MSPLWSGRFSGEPAQELRRLADSIAFDIRLWPYDIAVTRAHAAGLADGGLLTADELLLIEGSCDDLTALFESGDVEIHPDDEDIHSVVERFLTTRLGDTGARVHAGRSRNDLVATDMRLWAKDTVVDVARGVHGVQEALYRLARENDSAIMPGYTHLQRAQPISVAHHFLAHAFAVARDFERLISAYRRADVCPLGAAAFSGTSLPINPKATALRLGFRRTFDNAADAVSSRDFLVEFVAALAMVAVNLSRIGEEIVLWTSSEFGFATLDDAYSTGSSIMPQKRNPDPAELVRAKSARVTADLVALLGVLKGLPLAYNRDLQEDKEAAFDAADTVVASLSVMKGLLETLRLDTNRMEAAAQTGSSGATDMAEALVRKGVPFREAHEVVGKLVARLGAERRDLISATAEDLSSAHEAFDPEMLSLLDARSSVASRTSHGGTAPERIAEQFAALEATFDDEERWLGAYGA